MDEIETWKAQLETPEAQARIDAAYRRATERLTALTALEREARDTATREAEQRQRNTAVHHGGTHEDTDT